MSLNVKNAQVEKLVDEVVALTGETKTEAIRRALVERRARLAIAAEPADVRLRRYLEEEVWPQLPVPATPWSKELEEALLGYGPEGA